MRLAALLCIVIGLLGTLMAGLTALGAAPGFIDFGLGFGEDVITTAFWGGLAALLLLAAIAFGVSAEKE